MTTPPTLANTSPTCSRPARSGSPWLEKRNDVSDRVWCLENDVEEDEHEANFPGLSAPTSVQENADEPSDWDAEDIRETWLQNVGT